MEGELDGKFGMDDFLADVLGFDGDDVCLGAFEEGDDVEGGVDDGGIGG